MSQMQRVDEGAFMTCSSHCASDLTAVMNLSDGDGGAVGMATGMRARADSGCSWCTREHGTVKRTAQRERYESWLTYGGCHDICGVWEIHVERIAYLR